MRWLFCLLLAACAARQTPALAPTVPYRVAPENEPKLSAYVIKQWRDDGLTPGEYMPIIITITGSAKTATDALLGIGAGYVFPVTTSPGAAGTLEARATKTSDQLLAMLPNDALRFVVAQPWVVRLDGAGSWPTPQLPPEVDRRLDPELRIALYTFGKRRLFSVGAVAESRGCLTDQQRDQVRATGAVIGSVISHPSCSYTIFTFEIPLSRLVELASLPFIVTMEGGGHYSPETTAESKNE